jgi:hypothetical protein
MAAEGREFERLEFERLAEMMGGRLKGPISIPSGHDEFAELQRAIADWRTHRTLDKEDHGTQASGDGWSPTSVWHCTC